MVIATLLWGATFVVIRETLARLDPVVLVAARFSAAGAFFLLLFLVKRRKVERAAALGGTIAGVLYAAGFVFQAIGLEKTSAGSSAFLTSTGSLLAILFAWPLLRQRPSTVLFAGLALALLGSALLAGQAGVRFGPGERWTLLGASAFALQIVAIARYAPGLDPLVLTGVQACVMAVLLLPFSGGGLKTLASLAWIDQTRLLYLIVAGSIVAPWLQVIAQGALPAGRIGLLFTLEPVFALLFALTLGGERFPSRWWWGAGLVLLAVTMVEIHAARSAAGSRPASA